MYRYVNDALGLQLCRSTQVGQQDNPFCIIIRDISSALNVWHRVWSNLKLGKDWEDCGFWKNGDQYETAIRLLLSQNARPELHKLLGAGVNRLDALKAFNARTGRQH